jgi:hypothetical protein
LRNLAAAYGLAPGNRTSDAGGYGGGGVFVLGHSMGGIVARLALSRAAADPGLGPRAAALLITMASPQAASPVMLAPAMARLQRRLAAAALPAGVPVVSINGGARDVQARGARAHAYGAPELKQPAAPPAARAVRPSHHSPVPAPPPPPHPPQVAEPLTSLQGVTSDPALAFEAATLDIPGVWAQAGHNEIAWCNQLLRRLAVLLLSLAEAHGGPAANGTRGEHGAPLQVQAAQADAAVGGSSSYDASAEGTPSAYVPPPPPPRPSEEQWAAPEAEAAEAPGANGAAADAPASAPRASHARRAQAQRTRAGAGADEDAALIVYHLRSRGAHALAAAPATIAGAAAAAAAWPAAAAAAAAAAALGEDRAAAAAAAAQAAAAAPLLGPAAALDAAAAPRACEGPDLRWYCSAPAVRREAVSAPSSFFHGSARDDEAGALYSWEVPQLRGGGPPAAGATGSAAPAGAPAGAPGAGGLLLVASAAKPCAGFRLWLELEAPAGPDGSGSGSGGSTVKATVELSHAAAALPSVSRAAALKFKNPE